MGQRHWSQGALQSSSAVPCLLSDHRETRGCGQPPPLSHAPLTLPSGRWDDSQVRHLLCGAWRLMTKEGFGFGLSLLEWW